MYFVAHVAMLVALLLSLFAAGLACIEAWTGNDKGALWLERLHMSAVMLMTIASGMLLRALLSRDFSLSYVAQYTDSTLPFFYTITAFWAGQAGSLLFWALVMGLAGGRRAWSGVPQKAMMVNCSLKPNLPELRPVLCRAASFWKTCLGIRDSVGEKSVL